MKDRGVEVVDGYDVFDRAETEFIGSPITERSFDAGSRHPTRKTRGIVVAATGAFLEGGHSSKRGTPHH